jgi:hypothetical protein
MGETASLPMKHLIRYLGIGLLLGLLCVLSCDTVWAQAASTAQISGVIRDQTGAILPGAEISVTQTETGLRRNSLSNETGAYVLTNLPTGPYRLEVGLPGFRTYVQTGIVLQVNSNPVVNVVLEVGQVAETIEVQADAAMVETRSSGVGTVVDNQRVVEMPLNGRNATELIHLSGLANVSTGSSTTLNSTRNYPTVIISVAGGTGNGITYQLDGANHNDTQNSLNLPLPFPDALQEFKVETSALPAQYGYHSNAVVNAITKSGTNEFHGDAFEFLRNGALNARDFFAAKRDTLRRNQFGGVIGGPIRRGKLFFFGGYQGTIQKSDPQQTIAYIPTSEMLAGDFRTVASPTCNGGRQITLAASQGFVNNQISPSRFSPVTVKLASLFPTTTDPCGKVTYGLRSDQTENLVVTRLDYQRNEKHSMFERFTFADLDSPSTYDGKNPLTVTGNPKNHARVYSLAVGDTYLIGTNFVSSFRAGVNRTKITRVPDEAQSWATLGAQNFTSPVNKISLGVSGNGFNTGTGGGVPVLEHTGPSTNLVEDVSVVKGNHQI